MVVQREVGSRESGKRRMTSIFIVEDDRSLAGSLRRLLEFAGFDVEAFSEPTAFWNRLRHRLPALVILDVYLGTMDGRVLCQLLRRQPATQTLPILLITGSVHAPDAAQYGADRVLSKPFAVNELLALVDRLLQEHDPTAPQREVPPAPIPRQSRRPSTKDR